MRLKKKTKTITINNIFLAFIIEPWGRNPPGYVALKCLKKKILGGKKERMLGFSYYKREYRLCVRMELFLNLRIQIIYAVV